MKAEKLRLEMLKYLLRIEHSGRSSLPNESDLAQSLGVGVDDVRDQLDILEAQSAILANKTFGNHYAPMLTGGGKLLLERMAEDQGLSDSDERDVEARTPPPAQQRWDVFIAHASEDKDEFVRPLATSLERRGVLVWFDECTLKVGDSLRRSIDAGLAGSEYGVVVLSPSFFQKEWPQKELDGLWARTRNGQKLILPVWRDVTSEEVASRSPLLADLFALKAEAGIESVAQEILDVVRATDDRARPAQRARLVSETNWIGGHLHDHGQLPPLPDHLVKFAVGYQPGSPIAKSLRLRPMAAQTWHRMDPGERRQLRELVEWVGWKWEDYWDWSERLWPRRRRPSA